MFTYWLEICFENCAIYSERGKTALAPLLQYYSDIISLFHIRFFSANFSIHMMSSILLDFFPLSQHDFWSILKTFLIFSSSSSLRTLFRMRWYILKCIWKCIEWENELYLSIKMIEAKLSGILSQYMCGQKIIYIHVYSLTNDYRLYGERERLERRKMMVKACSEWRIQLWDT